MQSELNFMAEILAEVIVDENTTFENISSFRQLLKDQFLRNHSSVKSLQDFMAAQYPPEIATRVRLRQLKIANGPA
tara:strand:+ start:5062 stop:5289 length:228 start_codon:yes stop_codon:yes gene_type:complete